ncbi:amino acid ABC transporter ATP-binding protein [Arthrobacter sp. UM1]|uniref:amino acid ABC transporter ATP-binding protein n=1 Tax=Arthrobacter sp. UM1 TaxID=2766776 RepID=UPI001CF680E6|nr:amino acid ABC transporter ATP-binding protein [Arthrobacter sp. UM1]MCB4207845.1 amino acid ABC transporter ATP-binding protein [Arthrobacter sp. UM1]
MSPSSAASPSARGRRGVSREDGARPNGAAENASRPNGGEPFLSVRGLAKSFGDHTVLRDIDLTVERGDVVALIGPSGSGKTTILRCLIGLEEPDAGVIRFSGAEGVAEPVSVDFSERVSPRERRRREADLQRATAMVFQQYNLFPHRTVLQNVIEGPILVQKRNREEAKAEALDLLARVGLRDKADAYPHELSGGQQQRVGIVRALALRPALLLFDEPTSALDPELVGDVLRVIRELAEQGWTMLIVTHELQFARQVASQVVFMDQGVVVESGAASEVLGRPAQARTQQFVRRLTHPGE